MICSILPEACFAVNSIVVYQAAADAQQTCCIKLNALVASAECTSSVFASECLYSRPRIEREHFVFNISILGHQYALLIRQHGQSRGGTNRSFTVLHSCLRIRNISACSQSAHPGLMQFAISEPVFQTSVPTGHKMKHYSCFSNF